MANIFIQDRNMELKSKVSHLEKQIGNLQKDSINQLKTRLSEVRFAHMFMLLNYMNTCSNRMNNHMLSKINSDFRLLKLSLISGYNNHTSLK